MLCAQERLYLIIIFYNIGNIVYFVDSRKIT